MMQALLHEPKIWIALSFVLFMVGFVRYALPFILKGLDDRSAAIQRELEEAVRLRESAQAILADYQKKQKDMIAQAEALLQRAKKEAENMKKQAQEDLKESIERRTRIAHEKIARAQADAISDIQANVVDVTIAAAEQIITEHMKEESSDATIELALKDIKRILH